MNASMPSSVQPPHAAQNPLIWFELSFVSVPVAGAAAATVSWTAIGPRVYGPSARLVKRQYGVQIVTRQRVGRIEFDGSAEMHDGLVAGAAKGERRTQVPLRGGGAGIEPQRLTKLGDRLVDPALAGEPDAEDVVHVSR